MYRVDLQDFNNTVITITFDPDENLESIEGEKRASILIFEDDINEATEQVLVIQLALVDSLNPAGVDISARSTSLGRIIDNDRKCTLK